MRNRFELEIERRAQGADADGAPETEGPGGFSVFMNNLFRNTVDSALAIPSATGDALAFGSAVLEGTAAKLVPGGRGFEFGERYREQQEMFPANLIRRIPRPTSDQIAAAGTAATAILPGGRSPSQAYDEKLTQIRDLQAADAAAHPIAAELGDVGGTVASLLLTKRPLQGTIRRAENAIVNAPTMLSRAADDAPGLARAVDRALSSQIVRLPIRGTFRAAETGLEAAYVEILEASENDPILAASLAAGGQVAGSAALQSLKGILSGGPSAAALKFSLAAMSTAGLWQMLKSATPGGRDRILESIETGYDKTTYAVALGVLGGIVGGRGRNSALAEDMPAIIEGLTSTPRGAVLHYLTEMIGEDEETQQEFESVLERMQADPDFRGENDFEREIVLRFRQALEPADGDVGRGPRRGLIDRSRQRPE